MNFADPSMPLLAAAGGDTVKLFDVSVEPDDPCTLSYTPSPGHQVNSVKWNHTNMVVASAGDDKKISLWRKNGKSMGTVPVAGRDSGDNVEESIFSINFSNKGSRYICSGGSGQIVKIWDLQRKRCIKWLRGHTDTITGAMYNCKDEHLASISLNGDLIIHNLASGARAAELKDPNGQVLRVLDYSRISRHLVATAGDDGSIHVWDTTVRSPKTPQGSWLKQHSAPTAGVSFSPSNDKMIASVGLDKKLYTFDLVSKKVSSCTPYDEAPFSSLAFRDDGIVLAAGTSSGRVVFYDVRGKPQPFTVLRAFGNSVAVTSLCWQRSKPVLVNENNCTADTALLGGSVEDSILMPDPLPSVTSSSLSTTTSVSGSRNSGRLGPSAESFSFSAASSMSTGEETPLRSTLWTGGSLARLRPSRSNFKDDMEVFSPLVEVQPITPSLDKFWNEHEGTKKGQDKKPSSLFPSSRNFPLPEEAGNNPHPSFDWKSSLTSKQDETSSFSNLLSPPSSFRSYDSSSITPPEAWGGERLSDKFTHQRQSVTLPSRLAMSGSMLSGFQDLTLSTSQASTSSLTTSSLSFSNLRSGETSSSQETSLVFPRRLSSYAERISTTPSFSDGTSLAVSSPKTKKTGAETREELLNSLSSRSDVSSATEAGILPTMNMEISSVMSSIMENQAELMKEVQSLRRETQQLRQLLSESDNILIWEP
ncbi:hypothetical protein RJ640_009401, partial [Escallonia rubra]